jgi:protein-S-isoprenylcysteine O-methyltransferase Ste14
MNARAELVQRIVFVAVMIGWCGFASIFLFRKQPPAAPTRKRERSSIIGIALQGISYLIVWMGWRQPSTPFIEQGGLALTIVLGLLTIALEVCSIWLVLAAVRALGRQWSLTARVTEGHRLVVEGPYNLVRNPIYTGMLGMLIATGLALSRWPNLLLAILVFIVGTLIRVRSEERLLREAFGQEFEAYSSRVPAIIPGLY